MSVAHTSDGAARAEKAARGLGAAATVDIVLGRVAELKAALGTEAVMAKALEIAYDNMHASLVNPLGVAPKYGKMAAEQTADRVAREYRQALAVLLRCAVLCCAVLCCAVLCVTSSRVSLSACSRTASLLHCLTCLRLRNRRRGGGRGHQPLDNPPPAAVAARVPQPAQDSHGPLGQPARGGVATDSRQGEEALRALVPRRLHRSQG